MRDEGVVVRIVRFETVGWRLLRRGLVLFVPPWPGLPPSGGEMARFLFSLSTFSFAAFMCV